jgi:hypothetical protein
MLPLTQETVNSCARCLKLVDVMLQAVEILVHAGEWFSRKNVSFSFKPDKVGVIVTGVIFDNVDSHTQTDDTCLKNSLSVLRAL